jgi:hypothetical protein
MLLSKGSFPFGAICFEKTYLCLWSFASIRFKQDIKVLIHISFLASMYASAATRYLGTLSESGSRYDMNDFGG